MYCINILQLQLIYYIGSKKQCEAEDRVLDEEAIQMCEEDTGMENNQSSDSETVTPKDEENKDKDKVNKGTDNAENLQKPKRKRRLLKNFKLKVIEYK